MNLGDLLTPWFVLAAVLVPLVFVEKWIHAHLYGVGWLLTNDKKSATALYYVLLFPGVVVHEFTQYLIAGALNVKIKRVIAWPQAQSDGTLRLDFVQIKNANRVQGAIIGAAPLFTGLALVWLISSRVLNLDNVVNAIGTGSLDAVSATLRDAASAPDFLLWIYVIFTISNAMLPTPADREGWPLLVGVFAVGIAFLLLIGVGDVLMETFTGPVAHGVNRLTTAFATVLIAEVPGILTIGFVEEILEKTTKRKFEYAQTSSTHARRTGREPGSNLPLPAGAPLPSIYNLDLPIPSLSEVKALPSRSRRSVQPTPRPALAAEGSPPTTESPLTRRSTPPGEEQPAASDERPAFRRPGDQLSPAAAPDSPFPRRSTPPGEQQPAASDERPAFRRPGDQPSPAASPDSPFPRRSTPPGEQQPPVRPAFRMPALADDATSEDDERTSGYRRPPGLSSERPTRDQPPGALRRPSSPLTGRPSPFATGPADDQNDENDEEEVEEEVEEEDAVYEDFDDDSVLDNVYGDDDE